MKEGIDGGGLTSVMLITSCAEQATSGRKQQKRRDMEIEIAIATVTVTV